jgi:pyridoxamine 5'-phosphate oxidase
MKNSEKIDKIRRDYVRSALTEADLDPDPYLQFCKWFDEMLQVENDDPTAFILSTSTPEGKPSSRVVLLKKHSPDGFVFFTNYGSKKGRHILANPYVSMLFFWPETERQVRIEGKATIISEQESDEYFQSRPRESRIAAMISKQSSPVEAEKDLNEIFEFAMNSMCQEDIIRPAQWGGFLIIPELYEFWQGRPARLHDRFQYDFSKENNSWKMIRLQP